MEKPILFNTDMVRAILDGRKTVTRRLIKEPWGDSCPHCRNVHNEFIYDNLAENVYCARCGEPLWINPFEGKGYTAPYKTGDTLYVREAYCPNYFDEEIMRIASFSGNRNAYKADYHKENIGDIVPEPKWIPSIHMPKQAARIWLKVTNVRVERLQDITEEQAKAEGVCGLCYDANTGEEKYDMTWFKIIWDSTIRKSDLGTYGWNANPWVWVIEFERCEKPEQDGAE